MKIIFDLDAFRKFRAFIDNCEDEISGLGRCDIDTDGTVYVWDVFILKQSVTGATTNIDDEAQAKFIFEETKRGTLKSVNLWWHSHAKMGTFWSQTDEDTIKRSKNSDFMVSIVGNHAGDVLGRVDVFKPFHISCPINDVTIDYADPQVTKFCKEEIADKVTKGWSFDRKWDKWDKKKKWKNKQKGDEYQKFLAESDEMKK